MSDVLAKVYCLSHFAAKKLLGRIPLSSVDYLYAYTNEDAEDCRTAIARGARPGSMVNDERLDCRNARETPLFYGENAVSGADIERGRGAVLAPCGSRGFSNPREAWKFLIDSSVVPQGWRNEGLHLVCYSKKVRQWCLSDWVWTSAAVARHLHSVGDNAGTVRIADEFLRLQLSEGPWVVRFDYTGGVTVPTVAPNDSCYIARNALLPAWRATGDERYLIAARRCADWVIETASPSGLVYLGLDFARGKWIRERNIVDTGFTAALFADLYELTGEDAYRSFLGRFVDAYTDAFFDPDARLFATGILGDGPSAKRTGGHFARGQAWALEGLIPAFRVLRDGTLKPVIDGVVDGLLDLQGKDGGWPYNLSRRLTGQDCKGTPVIARALAEWSAVSGRRDAADSARRAISWCERHTDLDGDCPGGIFSYCLEGAVTHYLYSEAAFVYSSSYALEALSILGKLGRETR